jgi:hypothetical protein
MISYPQARACFFFRRFCLAPSFSTAVLGTEMTERKKLSNRSNWLSASHLASNSLVGFGIGRAFIQGPAVLAFSLHDFHDLTIEITFKSL